MRKAPTFIAVLLTLATAGCVVSGKPKTPTPAAPAAAKPVPTPTAPQPGPALSIPQTQVDLPRFQPVDPAALATETPAPPPVEIPDPPVPARTPPGRTRPTNATTTTAPAPQPPAAIPLATPEPAPPQIQEIVPQGEVKRLQDQAQARRRDVQQMLDQLSRRQLSTPQRNIITNINSFIANSIDAEKRGDMKTADSLADRAQVLARDLINGK